ncbi:hypothetical protein DHD32_18540 [Arenibacter sp. TNZ]|nr:hypothetical protein [Arenibacter sp. TNZ]
MKSQAEFLVKLCHSSYAVFIPSKDEKVHRLTIEKVAQDNRNETGQGYDDMWVDHSFFCQ